MSHRSLRVLPAFVVAICLLGAGSQANAGSFIGAETFAPGSQAFRVQAGFPGIDIAWMRGQSTMLDMAPKIGFSYGYGFDTGFAGIQAGAEFRYRLLKADRFNLVFFADPGIMFGSPKWFMLNLGLPGLRGDYLLNPSVRLVAGVGVPIRFWLAPSPQTIQIPLVVDVGAELKLTELVTIFGDVQIGPRFGTRGEDVRADFRALVGVGFRP